MVNGQPPEDFQPGIPSRPGFFRKLKTTLDKYGYKFFIGAALVVVLGSTAAYFVMANSFKEATKTTVNPTRTPTPSATPEDTATPTPTLTPTPTVAVVDQTTPAPTPVHCKNGQYASSVGKSSCSYTFQATEVPARFEAASIQVDPRTSLYSGVEMTAVCVEDSACEKFAGGAVTTETGRGIDWKITKPTQIAITSKEVFPEYTFSSFVYDHPAGPICTADHLYCYSLSLEYSKN